MGDFYCNIVPLNVDIKSASDIADRIINHLIDRKIISDRLTDCVLGQDIGYPPANNFSQILEYPDEHLLSLRTNGVRVDLGRNVFYTSDVDKITCPNCEENIVEMDWGQALDEWMNDTGNDKIICPNCTRPYSISEYNFEPDWAFGPVGLTFWNWGAGFKEEFVTELEQLTGHKIKLIYNKL